MIHRQFAGSAQSPAVVARSRGATHAPFTQLRNRCVGRERIAARAEDSSDKSSPNGSSGGGGKPGSEGKQGDSVQKAIDAMKADGIDSTVARKVLKAWQEDRGVEDGKDLRKQVFGFGVNLVALACVQLAVDIVASYCANQTAASVGYSQFAGSGIIAILLQTLSIYFAINAGLDLFRLGSVIGGTVITGARSEALYQAIEELAGDQTGVELVSKAQAAVSTSKVVLAINSVRKALQDEMEAGSFKVGTLSSLTSLFVLQHAKEKYGWTPAGAGISESKAAEAAATFGKFDANEDNRLEFSEFKQLCNAADFNLSDEESKKAIELLDKRGSGYVEFDEFCSWWVDQNQPVEAAEKQASASKAPA